jgi:hypothetical protein
MGGATNHALAGFVIAGLWTTTAWAVDDDGCADLDCADHEACIIQDGQPVCDPVTCPDGCRGPKICYKGLCTSRHIVDGGRRLRIAGFVLAGFGIGGAVAGIATTIANGCIMGTCMIGFLTGAAFLSAGLPPLIAGYVLKKKRMVLETEKGLVVSGDTVSSWRLHHLRHGGKNLLVPGYLLLGASVLIVAIPAIGRASSDSARWGSFLLAGVISASCMLATALPLIIAGHVYRRRWTALHHRLKVSRIAPFLSPVPGGAMVGVGGLF